MFSDIETVDDRLRCKKTNKPLMEKKRRARINHCLNELKDILIMDKHASAGHAKWEKADILEMTVEYVKKIRNSRGLAPLVHTRPPLELESEDNGSVADAKSRLVSPTPSSSSTESGPPAPKRRRPSAHPSSQAPQAPQATTSSHALPHPSPIMPIPTAPTINPGLNFMAHQLIALQYHQHQMKMASVAPSFMPAHNLSSTLPIPMSTPSWRPM